MSRSTIAPPFDTTGLNPSQITAVNSAEPQLLVVAAPGSGKTRTLIARIQRQIHDGVDPRSLVVLTFTNTAANEIQKRLDAAQPTPLGFIGTIHSFCLRLLQQHGNLIGLPRHLTVIDQEDAEQMVVEAMARLAYKGTRKAVDEQVNEGLARWMPDKFTGTPDGPRGLTDAERVAYQYYWGLLTSGSLTFDMILEIGHVLITKMANPQIGDYQNLLQYQHLMVDEVNDSSVIDFEIYATLPVKTRFFCGDPDQRIMSFRNGQHDGFYQLASGAPANGWTLLFLDDNYRSGTEIIQAANRLIAKNTNRIPKEMRSATGMTGQITITQYDTERDEQSGIAAQIKKLVAENHT